MDVYDFLSLATDLSGVIVRVYDCNKEEVMFKTYANGLNSPALQIESTDYGDYDILGYDLYKTESGNVYLDLNIETEDDYE